MLPVIAAALLIIVATMAVFIKSKSFETVAGLCELMLLFGIFLMYLGYARDHHVAYGYVGIMSILQLAGLLLIFFWTSVLIYDSWLTFRHQKITEDVCGRFKIYCFFVIVGIAIIFLTVALNYFIYGDIGINVIYMTMTVLFSTIGIVDVVLLVLTGIAVFRMSKVSTTDHSWFESEKER